RPGAVGHMVPTGDLFRRLEVELLAIDGSGQARSLGRRWLGRRFAPRPQTDGLVVRQEIEDGRVGPAGRRLRFSPVQLRRGERLRWRVLHQRVLHAGADPRQVVLDGEIELAAGGID
ncbi:MAG: hypothetical protein KC457_31190, partial [Myxococcales bacterium]|nr:hypothetical protein [Myxococcales bacterium]